MKILLLTLFLLPFSALAETTFPRDFFFGLATAPGHVEDQLDDIWKTWGEQGKTRAFLNIPIPHERLRFWTKAPIELDLAAQTGIQVYRLGIDWGRIMPRPHEFDQHVIKHYKEILSEVKKRKMKVMLTLMHHSVPKWAQDMGGWTNEEMKKHFFKFSQKMIQTFQSDVEYWITINEGNVFATLAYTAGMWPPGEKRGFTSMLAMGPIRGETVKAMDRMSESHNEIYEWAHKHYPQIKMGIAHNMAWYTGKSWWNKISAGYTSDLMNWRMPEAIRGHMDFFGFNYYGAEWIKGTSVDIDPEEEYSEAGRAIYPQGLYLLTKEIHERFKNLPIIVTENGISDDTDILRKSYIIEHLRALKAAMDEGATVKGYILWTLADNMEWADGYCPKFGIISVHRDQDLKREPRPSYYFYQNLISTKTITDAERYSAWKLVIENFGKDRPFCRAQDGITALDKPVTRKFVKKDWRFSLPSPN